MESNHKKPRPKLSLELDQEKPPRKSIWQSMKEFVSNGLKRRISGEWKGKDWGEW